MLRIAYTTNDYIKVALTEWEPSIVDPTTLVVELAAITGSSDPIEGDWVTAAWVTESTVVKAQVLWQALVATPAARTNYTVWMRVTATPEVPVLHCGTLQTR